MTTATATTTGKIVQVIGPVIDVEYASEQLPELYNAIEITATTEAGQKIRVVAEVQQHIGRNQIRAVAMSSTDGITRGMDARDTGAAIAVPVGEAALGRILNVLGEPVDMGADIPASVERWRSTASARTSSPSSRRRKSSRPASRSSTSSPRS